MQPRTPSRSVQWTTHAPTQWSRRPRVQVISVGQPMAGVAVGALTPSSPRKCNPQTISTAASAMTASMRGPKLPAVPSLVPPGSPSLSQPPQRNQEPGTRREAAKRTTSPHTPSPQHPPTGPPHPQPPTGHPPKNTNLRPCGRQPRRSTTTQKPGEQHRHEWPLASGDPFRVRRGRRCSLLRPSGAAAERSAARRKPSRPPTPSLHRRWSPAISGRRHRR